MRLVAGKESRRDTEVGFNCVALLSCHHWRSEASLSLSPAALPWHVEHLWLTSYQLSVYILIRTRTHTHARSTVQCTMLHNKICARSLCLERFTALCLSLTPQPPTNPPSPLYITRLSIHCHPTRHWWDTLHFSPTWCRRCSGVGQRVFTITSQYQSVAATKNNDSFMKFSLCKETAVALNFPICIHKWNITT